MELCDIKEIDDLLDERLAIMKSLDNLNFNEFRCASVKVSGRLKCRKAIHDSINRVEYIIASEIYKLLVEEYNDVIGKLQSKGIKVDKKEFVEFDKQAMIDGLSKSTNRALINHAYVGPDDDKVYATEQKYEQ